MPGGDMVVHTLYVELSIVTATAQGVPHLTGVLAAVRQRGLDDDEQLVVGRMEVSLGQLQALVVLLPGQQRFGATFGHTLQHCGLSLVHNLVPSHWFRERWRLLNSQCHVDADLTLRVGRCTPVYALIFRLHLSNEEHIVRCHHVEAVLIGCQKVPTIFVPHDLWLGLAFS